MTTGDRSGEAGAARPRPDRRAAPTRDPSLLQADFSVVGLGASAGGLDAFRRLLDALPADSGMAFILIQHLDPTHASMMVDLLAGHTKNKVQQADDGMPLEPGNVYVIPPGTYLSIDGGALHLSEPQERHGARLPFDFFLRSLAAERGRRAICVVLSGTGADGTLGLKAIKEKGGLVVVQSPDEAGYDGMPRSAIATGLADYVLPVAEIPRILVDYGRRIAAGPSGDDTSIWLGAIIDLLRTRTTHDFALYKPGTLRRRTDRRMAMAAIADRNRYLDILGQDPVELELLAKDLLINVTSFFRDPDAFKLLAEQIVPDLVRRHETDQPLRIWVAGCSTGEETYSIAMLFAEEIAATKRPIVLQVFASDVDGDAVAFARDGIYPASIAGDVSVARLARFFTKEDRGLRIVPELRGLVVFTTQNVLADPPFSRLDLVSCRNLLIYLRPEAQEKVLLLFDFSLREGGILFLGGAETVAGLGDRFDPISKAHRIYRHVGHGRAARAALPLGSGRRVPLPGGRRALPGGNPRDLTQRALVDAYAPASVLINRQGECLYYSGPTDRYLRVAAGEPSRDLLVMAREGLRNKLRTAIEQAGHEHSRAVVTGARVSRGGGSVAVTIEVQELQSEGEMLLLVSFLDEPERSERSGGPAIPADAGSRVAELEHELGATRKELQSAIRDLEIANEEQTAVNEEAMSVNEEFQSTNEELVTSKEELQALNEELTALNSQLQETLDRQRSTSDDLHNILDSSGVATLFLDGDLNIRFFTPAATSLFRIIAGDIGRPLADLTPLAVDADLFSDARAVLTSFAPLGREIEAESGAWYNRRILPYRTQDGRVDGVVITFADISEIKTADREIRAARAYSDSIIDTVRQPLVVLDDELHFVSANRSFYRMFALEPGEGVGQPLETVAGHHGGAPGLRGFLERVQVESSVEEYEVEIDLPGVGRRTLLLNARKLLEGPLGERKILLAIDDITERRRAAEALGAAKREAEQANRGKSRFLAAASHDLRQPLQTLSFLQGILAKKATDETVLKLVGRLEETVTAMSGMLDTLLDINQLEAGIVRRELADFPIRIVLDQLRSEFAFHETGDGIDWRVIPSNLSVRSDPRLLAQMMRNLVSNAVKYTETGKVLLGCRRCGDRLRIEVWDTGIGIPAEQLSAIFEEFHQLDNPARERSKGLGLGLAIVQRLADLLGHAIDVRSRPGKGSVFTVEVPLAESAPVVRARLQPSPVEPIEAMPVALHSGTILVVEDEPAVREMLQLLLDSEGYRAVTAADGRAALELATHGAGRPDLVLADYNLPNGPNGLQVVRTLQETLGRHIPAIILSGDISTDTLREIARQGCAYLGKPVTAATLVHLIQELLAKKRPIAETGESPPAIYVVDDDRTVREALRDLLEADGRKVEIYDSCEAFLATYRPGRHGCLLIDARLPGMGGLELLQRLKGDRDSLPAIMITGHGDVPMAVQAMRAGAADFIEKPVGYRELLASIERALEQAGDSAKASAWRETAANSIAGLTARQRQIMDLVLAGHPSKNIAADLGVSQRTVENHRAAVMKKTGSRSIPALIRLALAATP